MKWSLILLAGAAAVSLCATVARAADKPPGNGLVELTPGGIWVTRDDCETLIKVAGGTLVQRNGKWFCDIPETAPPEKPPTENQDATSP